MPNTVIEFPTSVYSHSRFASPKSLLYGLSKRKGLICIVVAVVLLMVFMTYRTRPTETAPSNGETSDKPKKDDGKPTIELANIIDKQQEHLEKIDKPENHNKPHQDGEIDKEHKPNENPDAREYIIMQKPIPRGYEDEGGDPEKMSAVRNAFIHAWKGYEKYAWGYDELKPISNVGVNNWGNVAATIIDSLDTLWIMNLDEQFNKAKDFVAELSFEKDADASVFETTIRFLGGLLAAFELSNEEIFLQKAEELAQRMLPAFNTKTGIPYLTINLKSGRAYNPDWTGGCTFLAEFASIQMEWKSLGHYTGNKDFYDKAENINKIIGKMNVKHHGGLFPVQYNPNTNHFCSDHITFGARGDSFYEYLLKQYLQTKQTENKLFKIYMAAMKGMKEKLIKHSHKGNLTYVAQYTRGGIIEEMDHLVCFIAGTLAMDQLPGHLELAKELMYTCWQMYAQNPTGIAPEIAGFRSHDHPFTNQAPHYLLRPETVESLFVLYRITGDNKYREWGWSIFQAIEKHCKTTSAYSGLQDVGKITPQQNDRMDSFFLAETLKYLYLLFAPPSLISLDEFVLNTEAHPLRPFTPKWYHNKN